jgi:hypothetical protein
MLVNSFWGATNIGGANAFFSAVNVATNSTTSLTYVDTTISGVPVQISFTKVSAGTAILVSAAMVILNSQSTTPDVALGVNDGSTDWDINRMDSATNSNTNPSQLVGYRLLTGLAAGAKTITMRMRSDGSVSIACPAGGSLYLRAVEVDAT